VFESRKIKLLKQAKTPSTSKMKIKFIDDKDAGNKVLLKVEKIEESSYTGIVYNFECETHTFMCRNILTHNCDPLSISGVQSSKNGESLEQKTPC
jgi:intein/homing endonuclease